MIIILLFNHDYIFFFECFYVFSQIYVSKYLIILYRLISIRIYLDNFTYIISVDMKGRVCHFTEWQIHTLISKKTI